MSFISFIAILFIAFWGLFSIVYQFKINPLQKLPKEFTVLLSRWSFFAPNPGTYEFHLLFRSKEVSGKINDWKKIGTTENRHLSNAIWHPEKRAKKLIIGSIRTLAASQFENVEDISCQKNMGYLHLLSFIMSFPHQKDEISRQFLVIKKDTYQSPKDLELVIQSKFHKLKKQ